MPPILPSPAEDGTVSPMASLDGVPFRVNPTSVQWPYSIKYAKKKMMGGTVLQLLGVTLGDLVVEGVFGRGGWEEQKAFFDRVVAIMESQRPLNHTDKPKPVRFFWPTREWDFWVYIKGITQRNSNVAIHSTNVNFNPSYRLTMFIQEDNGDITKVARDSAVAAFVARLSAGLGWRQSAFNGPESFDQVEGALAGEGLIETVINNRAEAVVSSGTAFNSGPGGGGSGAR